MIDVCLAFHDKSGIYYRYACATLTSVLEHTRRLVRVHVLHDETLCTDARSAVQKVAAHFGVQVHFYTLTEGLTVAGGLRIEDRYGLGSVFRYFIPECIKADRVIYLDCDIIVLMDIGELHDASCMHDQALLCCVADRGAVAMAGFRRDLLEQGFMPERYFNSGVLVFNSTRIRQTVPHFAHACLRLSERHAGTHFLDQNVLNALFKKLPVAFLDEKFNTFMNFYPFFMRGKDELGGRILHYTGNKPWEDKRFPSARIFEEYYGKALSLIQGAEEDT